MMNRPKLSPQTIAELVNNAGRGLAGMMYTDIELFENINKQLPDGMKICYRTFQRYKAEALQYGENAIEEKGGFSPEYEELYHSFIMIGMRQKETLIKMMMEAEGNRWHRYKWLLEKKFPEFNQGCIMETFRRENSYLDEDYPMFHPNKHEHQQPPVTVRVVDDAPQPMPLVESQTPVEPKPTEPAKAVQPQNQPTVVSAEQTKPSAAALMAKQPTVYAYASNRKKQKGKKAKKVMRTA